MNNAKYELVVFDLAGTTVYDDDDVAGCLRSTLKDLAGLEITAKQANTLLGRAKDVGLAEMLTLHGRPHSPSDEFVLQLLAEFEKRMIEHYLTHPSVAELADASDVFKHLNSHGVKVGIDTGFSVTVTKAILERMGWEKAGLIDAWTSCDQVNAGRPSPDMIYQLMQQLGITDTKHVIKIGDTPNDIKMGRAAKCGLTIGVLNGSHREEELAPHQPDLLLNDIRGLLEIIPS